VEAGKYMIALKSSGLLLMQRKKRVKQYELDNDSLDEPF
jgi:hypothetical protein